MKKMTFVVLAVSLFSFAAQATHPYLLGVGCGETAAQAATDAVYAKFPIGGTWAIQDLKTLKFASEYSYVLQSNVQELDGKGCTRVTVKGHAGATDCRILSVYVEKLDSVKEGLCK